MAEQKYAVKDAPELPRQTWLKPLPKMVRELDDAGRERGRWLRVYETGQGEAAILRTVPVRNTIVVLPAGLVKVGE